MAHESINTADTKFKLSEQARELLQSHGWPAFKKACGTQFYVGRTLGAQYTILYEMREARARRSNRDTASASVSSMGISVESSFDKSVARANENQTLRSHVAIAGGDASVSMNVTDANSLRLELEHLATSLANRNGRALEWAPIYA